MKKFKKIIAAVTAIVLSAVGMAGMSVCADDADNFVMGDANADGKFNIADVTLFQSWIMGKNVTLNNGQAVDFCNDGILDSFDLCMMKSELIANNSPVDEFTPCTATIDDVFVDYAIVITMKQQYSKREWTAEDFKGVQNIDTILDATPPTWNRQILYVLLKDCSKENVLKMVHDIENLNIEEIYMVRPTSWETEELEDNEYPVENPVVIDEFTPCTATLTDFFDTSGIHIQIKHQYSVSERVWTVDDFKRVENIKSVSQDDYNNYNISLFDQKPYRQIVTVNLEECSKENVLKMVQDIEALNLPEIKEIKVFTYGTGALPMTPEEWEEYINNIK